MIHGSSWGQRVPRPSPAKNWFSFLHALRGIDSASSPKVVAVVLKHGATGRNPESMYGQFTQDDEKRAVQVGRQLKVVLDKTNLRLLVARSSAYPHTAATCEALLSGSGSKVAVTEDPLLGNPSIFIKDLDTAKKVFKEQGHDYCTEALIRGDRMPGWSVDPGADAKVLLTQLLESIPQQNGIGLFVSHDIVIGTMVSWCLGRQMKLSDLPVHLDGAVFWREGQGLVEVRCCGYSGKCKWEL